MASVATEAQRLESPYFIEVRKKKTRTAILCGGLPYHRRNGLRMLDTLLVVPGETARHFRLGVALDEPFPLTAALEFLGPRLVLPDLPSPPGGSGWLFHLDVRNVVATAWEPIQEGGHVVGFRVRLLETEGRSVAACLRSFRTVRTAQRTGDRHPARSRIAAGRRSHHNRDGTPSMGRGGVLGKMIRHDRRTCRSRQEHGGAGDWPSGWDLNTWTPGPCIGPWPWPPCAAVCPGTEARSWPPWPASFAWKSPAAAFFSRAKT